MYPSNVGILALDVYFPQTYVSQTSLEVFDKVPKGKYTVGLAQKNMAFCGDREDIISLCLSAVDLLITKNNIDPDKIGRLEVGTETIIDKSKSVKTYLMDLFKSYGSKELQGYGSIEGVDTINACFGGTNALFNAIQWIESSYWDGRYAIVVAGDIAVYSRGPARPTGGCGVVSMLIGPNSTLPFDRGLRGVHMENVYDFYKPNLDSEYPLVDGKLSIECYLRAVDLCYIRYCSQFKKKNGVDFTLQSVDYLVFHSPYNKLVQKSYARLFYNDFLRDSENPLYSELTKFKALGIGEGSYFNSDLEKALLKLTQSSYQQKVSPSTVLPKEVGNTYCASLYFGLISLLNEVPSHSLIGKKVLMFSYGSGLAATFFSLQITESVENIVKKIDLSNRLAKRIEVSPEIFTSTMKLREERHTSKKGYFPSDPIDPLLPTTYYLKNVDDKMRRFYEKKPKPAAL